MGKNIFAAKHFHDEAVARQWFEAARWPTGAYCPECGSLEPYKTKKPGVYRCREDLPEGLHRHEGLCDGT